jgi:hypothetical protein
MIGFLGEKKPGAMVVGSERPRVLNSNSGGFGGTRNKSAVTMNWFYRGPGIKNNY